MDCLALTVLFVPQELCIELNLKHILHRHCKVSYQILNSTQAEILYCSCLIENSPLFPEDMQGVLNEGEIYNLSYSYKMQDLSGVKHSGSASSLNQMITRAPKTYLFPPSL